MARITLKQPNGKYAIFTTICDGFIISNATREELIADLVKEATEKITEDINEVCDALDEGKRSFRNHSTMTWDYAVERCIQIHGELGFDPNEVTPC
jgi:gamma-glutamyl:cysteine ligase YbdK (ATP-grasp superfamily)